MAYQVNLNMGMRNGKPYAWADVPTPYGVMRMTLELPEPKGDVGDPGDEVGAFGWLKKAIKKVARPDKLVKTFIKEASAVARKTGLPLDAPFQALKIAERLAHGDVKALSYTKDLMAGMARGSLKSLKAYEMVYQAARRVPIVKVLKAAAPALDAASFVFPVAAPMLQATNAATKFLLVYRPGLPRTVIITVVGALAFLLHDKDTYHDARGTRPGNQVHDHSDGL